MQTLKSPAFSYTGVSFLFWVALPDVSTGIARNDLISLSKNLNLVIYAILFSLTLFLTFCPLQLLKVAPS